MLMKQNVTNNASKNHLSQWLDILIPDKKIPDNLLRVHFSLNQTKHAHVRFLVQVLTTSFTLDEHGLSAPNHTSMNRNFFREC